MRHFDYGLTQDLGQPNRHGVADLPGDFVEGTAVKPVVIGEGLESGGLPQGDAPVLLWVDEPAALNIGAAGGDGGAGQAESTPLEWRCSLNP